MAGCLMAGCFITSVDFPGRKAFKELPDNVELHDQGEKFLKIIHLRRRERQVVTAVMQKKTSESKIAESLLPVL